MIGIVIRGSIVASILGMLVGFYLIYDAHQKLEVADNAISAQAALQVACGEDPACITSQSFDWIDDSVAGFGAERQIQQGRYVIYASIGVLLTLTFCFVLRWVITGKVRSSPATARDRHEA